MLFTTVVLMGTLASATVGTECTGSCLPGHDEISLVQVQSKATAGSARSSQKYPARRRWDLPEQVQEDVVEESDGGGADVQGGADMQGGAIEEAGGEGEAAQGAEPQAEELVQEAVQEAEPQVEEDVPEAPVHVMPRQEDEWDVGGAQLTELTEAERTAARNTLAVEEQSAADAVRNAAMQEEMAEESLSQAAAAKKSAAKRLQSAVEEQALEAKMNAMKAEQKLKEIREATADVHAQEAVAEARTGGTADAAMATSQARVAAATKVKQEAKMKATAKAEMPHPGERGWWNPHQRMGGIAHKLNEHMQRWLPPGVVAPFHSSYKAIYQGPGVIGGEGMGGEFGGEMGDGGTQDFFTGMIGSIMMR